MDFSFGPNITQITRETCIAVQVSKMLTPILMIFSKTFEDFEMKTENPSPHTQTSTQQLTQTIRGMLKRDSLFELCEAC